MKHLFLSVFTIAFFSGCVPKYVEPIESAAVANLSFERESKAPLLGSSTFFIALDDSYLCDPAKGFAKQKKMATIDKGNPLIKNENNGPFRILAKDNFRILVRNVAGFAFCDVVLGFKSEQTKSYLLNAVSDLKSDDLTCSAKVAEIADNETIDVDFNEYQSCNNADYLY